MISFAFSVENMFIWSVYQFPRENAPEKNKRICRAAFLAFITGKSSIFPPTCHRTTNTHLGLLPLCQTQKITSFLFISFVYAYSVK